ncbi:ABC transporter ATP-binding protein, partial [Schumannella luteola]
MTRDHLLEARHVTLAYGDRTVVEDLDLDVAPGRITAIVGPNGCGKSTLLRALARLLAPTGGQVLLDGEPLASRPTKQVARVLGLLPQSPVAPEGITVADLVGRGRHPHQRLLARWNEHDYAAVAAALEATEIADLAERSVDELSGG